MTEDKVDDQNDEADLHVMVTADTSVVAKLLQSKDDKVS